MGPRPMKFSGPVEQMRWGTWTRTKTNGTRNRRAANYPIPHRERLVLPAPSGTLADGPAGPQPAAAARRRARVRSLPSSAIDSGSGGATAAPHTAARSGR